MTPPTQHDPSRPRGLALFAGVAVILALAGLGGLSFARGAGSQAAAFTPTPTKTPAAIATATVALRDITASVELPTATPIPTATQPPTPTAEAPADWVAKLAQARGLNPQARYIVVDQNNQQMHIVDQGHLVRLLHISTGDPRYGWDTPEWFGVIGDYWGTFNGRGGVLADEGWFLFERGGSFLIHGLPYTLGADNVKHYKGENELGALPVSSGCIRLAPEDAAWFSTWQPQGAPIIILPFTGLRGKQG